MVLAVSLVTACQGDQDQGIDDDAMPPEIEPADGPDFEVRYATKYVDIAPGFSQPVCRGTLEEVDRHVAAVTSLLQIDPVARPTWYWFNDSAEGSLAPNGDFRMWCSRGVACTAANGTAMYSRHESIAHELVHAFVIPAWGRSDILFEEGAAYGLSRRQRSVNNVLTRHSLLDDFPPSEIAGGQGGAGGHFSRWLVDSFGPQSFRELFSPRLGTSSTAEEVFAAVEEVYGVPFAELEADYFATAPTIYPIPALCDGLVHIPWDGDRWEMRLSTDCDAAHVFGPRDGDATNYVAVTLEIPPEMEDVPLAGWFPSGGLGGQGELIPCIEEPLFDTDPEVAKITHFSNGPTLVGARGRYRLELPIDDSGEARARLCPDNGLFPGAYPTDPDVDPMNCVGDPLPG